MGLFKKADKNKYLHGFAKTSDSLGRKLRFVTENKKQNKEDFMEQLMVTLIEADIGYQTSELICDRFFAKCQNYYYLFAKDIMYFLGETFRDVYYEKEDEPIVYNENGPTVILMVGVNGSGKTSTCAKLAYRYLQEGKTVAFAAADTFRAGAIEQLDKWAQQLNIPCIKGKENQDPSSVLVDACRYARDNSIDILICDTAGRLQNKLNLMAELEKMSRVLGKEISGAPHDSWLVLDANTGQNGLSQAQLFSEITDLNGIILTKMDGTSKGGIIVAIKHMTGLPVRYITVGEHLDDLQDFDFDLYLESIIGDLKHAK
jgi:fused signal recognition particle receptor